MQFKKSNINVNLFDGLRVNTMGKIHERNETIKLIRYFTISARDKKYDLRKNKRAQAYHEINIFFFIAYSINFL